MFVRCFPIIMLSYWRDVSVCVCVFLLNLVLGLALCKASEFLGFERVEVVLCQPLVAHKELPDVAIPH